MADMHQIDDKVVHLIQHCDKNGLLTHIHEAGGKESPFKNIQAYHTLVRCLIEDPNREKVVTQLIYLLALHGADANLQDKEGSTALLLYLKEVRQPSDCVLQALLRCGSNATLKNKCGEDALEFVLQAEHLPRQVKARILEYLPGIWKAVEADDAMTVRRLINQWCSIHVEKDDMTVLQLAFNKGTEDIIRVISGIGSSMDIVHAVLAGDVRSVKTILESSCKYNTNLKNMGDRGSTPLFYAMCDNDRSMVDVLLKHGARLDIGMQGENEFELPLYFAALSNIPSMEIDMLLQTIPSTPVPVDQLYYKGRNVLFFCIDHKIEVALFEAILSKCSARMLTQTIQVFGETLNARSFAQKLGNDEYVAVIDKIVTEWCSKASCHDKRNILALHGYQFTPSLCCCPNSDGPLDSSETFFQMLPEYEEYKSKLVQAVEDGDLISVKEMLYSESWSCKGLIPYFADSRVIDDGQPLLHKAVLRRHVDTVREIAQCLVYKCNVKLDSVKDQFFRTAYHYAHGMEDVKELVFLLEDIGMSEFAMDKDGRSPLVFKDRKGQKEMKDLIAYQIIQDYSTDEPDPWSTPLPLPIVGYLTKCLHEHKSRKKTDHFLSNMQAGELKSTKENRNEQLYTKIDPEDFYRTNKVFCNGEAPKINSQVNGKITQETDHYQILDTSNTCYSVLESDYGNNDYLRDELSITTLNCEETETLSEDYNGFDEIDRNSVDQDLESEVSSYTKGDSSCSEHDSSELEDEIEQEDYDGDYSDLDSEDEQDKDKITNYCVIL